MRRRRRGGHNYKFTEKTHSIRGIIAIVLAAASLFACGFMLWYSYSSRGNAGIYVGSAGIFGFFVAVLSVILAVSSVREPETFRIIPYTSLGVSLAAVAVWIALYVGGI